MPTPYESIEKFKKNARLLKKYTKDGKHQQSLDLFAKILGYTDYQTMAGSDIARGDEPTLDSALANMMKLMPRGTLHLHRKILDDLGVLETPESVFTVLPEFSNGYLCDYLRENEGEVSVALQESMDISITVLALALSKSNPSKAEAPPTFGSLLEGLVHRAPDAPILASIQQVEDTAKSMLRIAGTLAVAACATGISADMAGRTGSSMAKKATTLALAELNDCYAYLESLPHAPLTTLEFISQFSEFISLFLYQQKRLIELGELTAKTKRLYAKAPSTAPVGEKRERAHANRALTLVLAAEALKKRRFYRALALLDSESGWSEAEVLGVTLLRTLLWAQLGEIHKALVLARNSAIDRSVVKLLLGADRTPEARQLINAPTATQLQQQHWKRFGFDLMAIKLQGCAKALRLLKHIDDMYQAYPTMAHSDAPEMKKKWFSFEDREKYEASPPIYKPVNTTWKFWTCVRMGIRYIP